MEKLHCVTVFVNSPVKLMEWCFKHQSRPSYLVTYETRRVWGIYMPCPDLPMISKRLTKRLRSAPWGTSGNGGYMVTIAFRSTEDAMICKVAWGSRPHSDNNIVKNIHGIYYETVYGDPDYADSLFSKT